MGENMRTALDLELYEDLKHVVHGYDKVPPWDIIVHLEDEHYLPDK